uniref:Uncharacterized protein n=1 Tax=Lepeophtheirus salmonis TaxID=72036 RepID=A0A0K2T232_LEPSM
MRTLRTEDAGIVDVVQHIFAKCATYLFTQSVWRHSIQKTIIRYMYV